MAENTPPRLYEQLAKLYGPEKAKQMLEAMREGRPIEADLTEVEKPNLRPYTRPPRSLHTLPNSPDASMNRIIIKKRFTKA